MKRANVFMVTNARISLLWSSLCDFVDSVLANEAIFGKMLKEIPVFAPKIAELIFQMTNKGILETIEEKQSQTIQ